VEIFSNGGAGRLGELMRWGVGSKSEEEVGGRCALYVLGEASAKPMPTLLCQGFLYPAPHPKKTT
jgi:hypothetical protein